MLKNNKNFWIFYKIDENMIDIKYSINQLF